MCARYGVASMPNEAAAKFTEEERAMMGLALARWVLGEGQRMQERRKAMLDRVMALEERAILVHNENPDAIVEGIRNDQRGRE